MGMVPSYETNEWQVVERRSSHGDEAASISSNSIIQIRVKEGEEWRDYWVPTDPANTDYAQYLAWLDEGNEPRIVL